jgi:hypothetical protein
MKDSELLRAPAAMEIAVEGVDQAKFGARRPFRLIPVPYLNQLGMNSGC